MFFGTSIWRIILMTVSPTKNESDVFPDKGDGNWDERILVVDDQESIRTTVKAILNHFGYKVFVADSGESALGILRTRDDIDLLLTDVIMPRMNGIDLHFELTRVSPKTKTLFMSGFTVRNINERDSRMINAQFIHKPFTPDQLEQKIRQILDCQDD